MTKKCWRALVGHLGGCVLLWFLIHLWTAEIYARISGYSIQASYRAQMALLFLWCLVRTVRIINGKDEIAQLVNRLLKKDE